MQELQEEEDWIRIRLLNSTSRFRRTAGVLPLQLCKARLLLMSIVCAEWWKSRKTSRMWKSEAKTNWQHSKYCFYQMGWRMSGCLSEEKKILADGSLSAYGVDLHMCEIENILCCSNWAIFILTKQQSFWFYWLTVLHTERDHLYSEHMSTGHCFSLFKHFKVSEHIIFLGYLPAKM